MFAAQAFTRGLGWPMLALLVAMDVGAAGGFGITASAGDLLCSQVAANGPVASSTELVSPANPSTGGAKAPLHVLGQKLSQTLGCTACHHVDNSKAVGPTWKNLAGYPQKLADGTTSVADYQFLRNAILYPERLHLAGFPPGAMPNSYRTMLSGPQHTDEIELNALIWYINMLSDRSSPATQPSAPDEPGKAGGLTPAPITIPAAPPATDAPEKPAKLEAPNPFE